MQKGFAEVVPDEDCTNTLKHYIPHHEVLTPEKATTKLRIVFDACEKTRKKNQSLNERLHRGPVILEDLCGLLLRFRLHKVALVADVEKAFLRGGLLIIHHNGPHGSRHNLTARCLNKVPNSPLAHMLCMRPQHWLEYRERAAEYPLTSQFPPFNIGKRNYSSLTKLLRVSAWALRFIRKLQKKSTVKGQLTSDEISQAKVKWEKYMSKRVRSHQKSMQSNKIQETI